MKASELRIGNWVETPREAQRVDYIHKDIIGLENCIGGTDRYQVNPIWSGDIEDLKGVPLTEEWLVKFGFEKTVSDGRDAFKKGDLWFSKDGSKWDFWFQDDESGDIFSWGLRPSYVHQLQNLYHSLTGEELAVNNQLKV